MAKAGNRGDTPITYELWRDDYVKDAYVDQTGMSQWGHVVYEQIIVTEIARFAQYEGYGKKWYPDVGRAAIDEQGRIFHYYANLVDYCGGGSWRLVYGEGEREWFHSAPYSTKGYVYPDGTGPVTKIKPPPEPKPVPVVPERKSPPIPPRPLKPRAASCGCIEGTILCPH